MVVLRNKVHIEHNYSTFESNSILAKISSLSFRILRSDDMSSDKSVVALLPSVSDDEKLHVITDAKREIYKFIYMDT